MDSLRKGDKGDKDDGITDDVETLEPLETRTVPPPAEASNPDLVEADRQGQALADVFQSALHPKNKPSLLN